MVEILLYHCMLVHRCYVRNIIDVDLTLFEIFIQRTGEQWKRIPPSTPNTDISCMDASRYLQRSADYCLYVLNRRKLQLWIEYLTISRTRCFSNTIFNIPKKYNISWVFIPFPSSLQIPISAVRKLERDFTSKVNLHNFHAQL